jgi:hypothetical protein
VCIHVKSDVFIFESVSVPRVINLLQRKVFHIPKFLYWLHNLVFKFCNFEFGNFAIVVLADY